MREFSNIDQTEIALVYSALDLLWSHKQGQPSDLKHKIQNTYGFRL